MTWAIINKVNGFYYSGKLWRWSSTPKIYAKIGWAKSALTGLQKQTWDKNSQNYEIIEYPHIAKFNLYQWRDGECSALFVDGKYATSFLGDTLQAVDIYYYISEGTPIILKIFELWEDYDKEIYFEEMYCEDEEVYKRWMETH